jgi:hypothetical protein
MNNKSTAARIRSRLRADFCVSQWMTRRAGSAGVRRFLPLFRFPPFFLRCFSRRFVVAMKF